jgi:hypothetical protein
MIGYSAMFIKSCICIMRITTSMSYILVHTFQQKRAEINSNLGIFNIGIIIRTDNGVKATAAKHFSC